MRRCEQASDRCGTSALAIWDKEDPEQLDPVVKPSGHIGRFSIGGKVFGIRDVSRSRQRR